jgi:hypothetical protein
MQQPLFDLCKTYLDAQWQPAHSNGFHSASPSLPAITISRQTAAGAVSIGKMLVEELNRRGDADARPWAVFDRNLVEQALEDHDLPKNLEKFMPENAVSGVSAAIEEMFGLHPSLWTLIEHTADTMRRLARIGHVVLVGRGANAVTAGLPNVLHVRLIGPVEKRVKHAQELYSLTPNEAVKYVQMTDRARDLYVRRHCRADVSDPLRYDLTINTGRVSFEKATRLILEALDDVQQNAGATVAHA